MLLIELSAAFLVGILVGFLFGIRSITDAINQGKFDGALDRAGFQRKGGK